MEEWWAVNLSKNEFLQRYDFPIDFLNKKSKEVLGKNFNIGDGVFVLSKKEIDLINRLLECIKIDFQKVTAF